MSMVLTRPPLEPLGMNGLSTSRRRSARLSVEGAEENEPPAKKSRVNGAQATNTKEQDGDANGLPKRRARKAYDEEVDGFAFKKGVRKAKEPKQPAVRNSVTDEQLPAAALPAPAVVSPVKPQGPVPAQSEAAAAPKPVPKKARRRFPTTPEREAAEKPTRRSKRLSNEHEPADPAPSPLKPSHAKSHANTERSPSPEKARPITIEKKRKRGVTGAEEAEKIMRITLPFQDTPVIRRNKEMRKGGDNGHRRSSSGMRGRRASSMMDEGRGNALPHSEVPTAEFYKHISADLTEPRRMRCLLGWCGTRALPPKPEAPKDSSQASSLEFQALQAARVIQAELSNDLVTNGTLSDWFSRDEAVPPAIPLRKAPNPRNIANAAKAEELERELERLKAERANWDALTRSAVPTTPPTTTADPDTDNPTPLSPLHPDLLSTPEREILAQLQNPTTTSATPTNPEVIQQRLRTLATTLEFSLDNFAHGIHVLASTRETAERLAEKSLADAAEVLEARDKERRSEGGGADAMDALRALGKVLNGRRR
ncbi:hypothetical protein LTR02_011553 [Friedmanniomyces endolithicus]|nr:hypothetical protein LTR59_010644 [Friedmanniomyces endolithicus]KAK0798395.1 hypothetical protein LTR75_009537 [Friedmanniomyces endolithicus]KAK0855591.1 hypothetical protein LTR03_001690 [Friedmanniomyces endolithicus]KAK0862822.1 hypothetical protein LTS02_006910 [Friedmanniomyces endolithicus]KAK0881297.1 hypothetical protein LTR87_004835 [Friedmanniomyces endolithicus]